MLDLLSGSGSVVNSLDFCPASLKSLGCFYFRCIPSSQWKALTVNLQILHCKRHFWRPVECVRQQAITSCSCYRMPQIYFFQRTRDLLVSQNTTQRHFFLSPPPPPPNPLFPVIFATATILAFVLLRNYRFNFHCYTQREATSTQKSARKCARRPLGRDVLCERLQMAFTRGKQLHWTAQYPAKHKS